MRTTKSEKYNPTVKNLKKTIRAGECTAAKQIQTFCVLFCAFLVDAPLLASLYVCASQDILSSFSFFSWGAAVGRVWRLEIQIWGMCNNNSENSREQEVQNHTSLTRHTRIQTLVRVASCFFVDFCLCSVRLLLLL